MLDLISLLLYCVLSLVLVAKACQHPIWAVGYYMLNFFAQPTYWSWGSVFPGGIRWSLIAGLVLLASVMSRRGGFQIGGNREVKLTSTLILYFFANATFVLVTMSYDWEKSWEVYIETAKFVLLFFLMLTVVQSDYEFRRLVSFLVLGLLYWGIQAKFGNIQMKFGRLEGFGGPGCAQSNELASILVMLLPIAAAMILLARENLSESKFWIMALASVGSGLNVLLLCNSRGGFLGLIVAVLTVLVLARGQLRRKAMMGTVYGCVALFLLLGNPKIMERFLTTFHSEEDAQQNNDAKVAYASRESRVDRWNAALMMLRDYPAGSGGNSFQAGRGDSYMAAQGVDTVKRSIHQGFLREACDWGIQGLLLHLSFLVTSACYAWKTLEHRRREGETTIAFMGLSILSSMAGFLITCLFSDLLHLEWGYWLIMLAVIYGRVYGIGTLDTVSKPHIELEDNVNLQSVECRLLVRS